MRTGTGQGLEVQYPRVYRMLKNHHGAAKAIEIVLDARRKDKFALQWIRAMRRM